MADTGTATETITQLSSMQTVNRIDVDWTSDASGDVEKAITEQINGVLLALITNPDGTDVPTSYDVSIEDDKGIDILLGKGASRSTSATEAVALDLSTGQPRPTAATSFTFKVANAGNAKKGFVQLLFR